MILSPGATIGILGAGQLGRMLAIAALKVGLRTHIFAPEATAPAYDAAAARTVAAFDDEEALARFAEAVDVVTYEFENVPVATVEFLAERVPVRPGARALALTQDRLTEKKFLRDLGLRTAPFVGVEDAGALARAVAELGRPAILKTRRFGYDGKGQSLIREGSNVAAVHRALGSAPMILEGFVAFEREASVVAARSLEGEIVAFDLSENEHERHILARTRAPARVSAETAAEARRIASLHPRGARLCRGARGRALRDPGQAGPRGARRQRDRAPRAQFRPLDARGRADVAVRTACSRHRRLAARGADAARTGRNAQSDRRGRRGMARHPGPAGALPASLRQARNSPRPQDGPRDPDLPGIAGAGLIAPPSALTGRDAPHYTARFARKAGPQAVDAAG